MDSINRLSGFKTLAIFIPILFFSFYPFWFSLSNAADKFYSIQLGSFQDQENAEEMVNDLKNLGHNAFYRKEENGQAYLFRVYIERFSSRSEAEKEAGIMKELDLISGYTIKQLISNDQKGGQVTVPSLPVGYYLQVSSLKEKENAEKTVYSLKGSGRDAFYRRETVPGKGEFYRVYIQGFKSKEEAQDEARALMDSGLINGYAIRQSQGNRVLPSNRETEKDRYFFLHIASYKEMKNAEEEVSGLQKLGLKAFFVKEQSAGETWIRVYIGEYPDEKQARKTGEELLNKGIITYFKPLEIDKDVMGD